jgi:hypothetical protein
MAIDKYPKFVFSLDKKDIVDLVYLLLLQPLLANCFISSRFLADAFI